MPGLVKGFPHAVNIGQILGLNLASITSSASSISGMAYKRKPLTSSRRKWNSSSQRDLLRYWPRHDQSDPCPLKGEPKSH